MLRIPAVTASVVFAAIILSSNESQAGPGPSPSVSDDRFGYFGPIQASRRAAKWAGQNWHRKTRLLRSGRHGRRPAGLRPRPPRIAVPVPVPRPLTLPKPLHPYAWLAEAENAQAAISVALEAMAPDIADYGSIRGAVGRIGDAAMATGNLIVDYVRSLYRPAHRGVRLVCGDGTRLPGRLLAIVNRAAGHFGAQAMINSGYRSPAHNRRVGGARNSQHVRCRAVDFYLVGVSGAALHAWALRQREATGVGRYRGNFVHVDIRPGRRVTWDWRGRSRRKRIAMR